PASAAGLSAARVPSLKVKWAFGLSLAEEAHSQPTIAGGRVFLGSDAGTVYSLDAGNGCVYWSFQADGAMRVAPSVAPVIGAGSTKYALYFEDQKANMYSVDADTGKLLWKVRVDEHPVAQITGAPTLYDRRLYVPMASAEERTGGLSMTYPCCTFRGSVTALDAKTGKQAWKTYIIPDPPKLTKKSAKGVRHYAPAGGAVWAAPTIDTRHHALYIGTGDAYTDPAGKTTDAVMALDMDTGKVLWSVQDTEDDAWLSGCGGGGTDNPDGISENCPKPLGPDYDFGSSMILRTLPDGHRVLGAEQGQTAALTVIPGVVFSGGWDGILRGFSTEDGHQIWEVNTAHDYKTVNGVKANGGSMASAGPTVGGGTLFVGSGYLFGAGGKPGNVLLAFTAP